MRACKRVIALCCSDDVRWVRACKRVIALCCSDDVRWVCVGCALDVRMCVVSSGCEISIAHTCHKIGILSEFGVFSNGANKRHSLSASNHRARIQLSA